MPTRATPLKTTDLTGRVTVITGAASGIGRELALLCARRGADLALCDISEPGLAATADAVRFAGRKVIARRVDVADAQQMTEFADATLSHYHGVDLLVNNAGVGLVAGFLNTTAEDWDRLVSINLMGVVHGCSAFLTAMVDGGRGGHVVNVSSATGLLANPELTAYSATKFAVVGLSEALRIEMRPHGIGVTAVCPGIINTAITQNSPIRTAGNADRRREDLSAMYKKRGYTPARVARNILRAVDHNRAVAPIAAEAHVMYLLSRATPPFARWLSRRLAEMSQ